MVMLLMVLLSTNLWAENRKILIGTSHYFPPFIMNTNLEQPSGFDITFVTTLCVRLKLDCSFKVYFFRDLMAAVEKNEVDLVVGAVTITSLREKEVLFSTPYLPSFARFLSHKKEKLTVKNIESMKAFLPHLEGKTVGVTGGTMYERELRAVSNSKVTIKVFKDYQSGVQALNSGSIHLFLTDDLSGTYWAMKVPNELYVYGPAIPVGDGYGLIIGEKAMDLRDQIDEEILKMESDGTFLNIYNTYFAI
jgi:ABC-type amino acid transport substrate-binding protein